MRLPAGFRALTYRDYQLFWYGQLVSLVGSWMQTVGQSWLVLELTGSALKLGLVNTLQFLPMLLFSLVAGAVVDRLPKRRLIITTQVVMMLLALALATLVWTGRIQYWHITVLACLWGMVMTVDVPARNAFIAELVDRPDLASGIALNVSVFNGARLVGPAVAGLVVARYGVAPAFFANAASYLAVLAGLLAIRAEGWPQRRERVRILDEVREGVAYALSTPLITLALLMLTGVSLFVINYQVLTPLLAREVLHQAAEGFGFLMSAHGAGALSGAVLMTLTGRRRAPVAYLMLRGLFVSAIGIALGFVQQFGWAAALLFALGAGHIMFTYTCNTMIQMTAPDALRGRMMSLYVLSFNGVMPIGSFLAGFVAEGWGAPSAYIVTGGLGMASVLALSAWWALGPRQRVALDGGQTAGKSVG